MKQPSKRRILCVDDYKDACELISVVLSKHEIVSAYTKAHGFHLASTERFDLIIIDHHLPDGTGLDLCREIRSINPVIPILFFTATTELTQQDVLVAGGQIMIPKSGIAELLPFVTSALESHAANFLNLQTR